jgi:hypothetical protein
MYLLAALPFAAKTFSPADLSNAMQYGDSAISGSCARFLSALACHHKNSIIYNSQLESFADLILPTILYAISCHNHRDFQIQACGTSILACLIDNGSYHLDILFP